MFAKRSTFLLVALLVLVAAIAHVVRSEPISSEGDDDDSWVIARPVEVDLDIDAQCESIKGADDLLTGICGAGKKEDEKDEKDEKGEKRSRATPTRQRQSVSQLLGLGFVWDACALDVHCPGSYDEGVLTIEDALHFLDWHNSISGCQDAEARMFEQYGAQGLMNLGALFSARRVAYDCGCQVSAYYPDSMEAEQQGDFNYRCRTTYDRWDLKTFNEAVRNVRALMAAQSNSS